MFFDHDANLLVIYDSKQNISNQATFVKHNFIRVPVKGDTTIFSLGETCSDSSITLQGEMQFITIDVTDNTI